MNYAPVNIVEYIQSDGSQFIDTGFNPNQDTGIIIKFQLTSVETWQCIIGAANDEQNSDSYSIWNSGTEFGFYYASENLDWSGISNLDVHVMTSNKNTATIDENTISLAYTPFVTNYPINIFAPNYAGDRPYPASMKLYYCQIFDNGEKVRDYIPCKDSNGTACLYEMLSGTYIYNSGAGSFISGPEI